MDEGYDFLTRFIVWFASSLFLVWFGLLCFACERVSCVSGNCPFFLNHLSFLPFEIYLLGRTMMFVPSVFPPSFFLFLFLFLWIYTLLIDERFLFRYRCTWQEKKNQDEKTQTRFQREKRDQQKPQRFRSSFQLLFSFLSFTSLGAPREGCMSWSSLRISFITLLFFFYFRGRREGELAGDRSFFAWLSWLGLGMVGNSHCAYRRIFLDIIPGSRKP